MRKFLFTLAVMALAGLFASTMAFAATAPSSDVTINKITGSDKYETIMFSHSGHAAVECNACHHTWDGSGDVKSCTADGCHTNADAMVKKGAESLYAAFHARKSTHSCVGCHAAKKKASEAHGPTSCTKCHAMKK